MNAQVLYRSKGAFCRNAGRIHVRETFRIFDMHKEKNAK